MEQLVPYLKFHQLPSSTDVKRTRTHFEYKHWQKEMVQRIT